MADRTTNSVYALGVLSLAFGRVDRITYHDDGTTPESDTDHTVMLGLIACAFAERHLPDLDLGLIAQYALVHDLVEVYAGDTPTLRINAEQRASKEEREMAAYRRIYDEFHASLPWVHTMIAFYEARDTPEARYVKAMDKLLPKVTHIANRGVTLRHQGFTLSELMARYEQQLDELQAYAADFPPLFDLRAELIQWVYETVQLDAAPTAVGGHDG
jgi:5'-deoxynucleotidase YfbR-like HD superfamily hydrolase